MLDAMQVTQVNHNTVYSLNKHKDSGIHIICHRAINPVKAEFKYYFRVMSRETMGFIIRPGVLSPDDDPIALAVGSIAINGSITSHGFALHNGVYYSMSIPTLTNTIRIHMQSNIIPPDVLADDINEGINNYLKHITESCN